MPGESKSPMAGGLDVARSTTPLGPGTLNRTDWLDFTTAPQVCQMRIALPGAAHPAGSLGITTRGALPGARGPQPYSA